MKRLFSFVLAIVMIFSMTAFAGAVDTDYSDAASHLAALDILKGDGKGNLMLDQNVTRYQAALFFVQALTGKTDVEIWNANKVSGVFTDVTEYGTAIDYGHGIGLILGRGNGVYGPNDNITYQDMLVMAVRALGYETDKMNYPYGYILAADKLGLTNDIDLVNYKAYLTRGETAQLMWNMLMTEVAYVDPLTGNILYPNETGLTDTIVDTKVDRVILLDKAGYTSDELAFTIKEFIPANEKDEDSVDCVKLDNGWVINAADLGITADTPKVSYLGLGGTLYINCDATDFENKYEDGEANIVVYDFDDYATITNLSDIIRYTDYLIIDDVKFKDYEIILKTFSTEGWQVNAEFKVTDLFDYDNKTGYTKTANPYCQVSYRTYIDANDNNFIEILYTDFDFGQYIERDLKYSPTQTTETFVLIGTYNGKENTNLDKDKTYFAEKTVNGKTVLSSMSEINGKASLEVTVNGDIDSGDFMIYNYNSVDNILTVYKNCGTLKTGRMTGKAGDNSTITINGIHYEVLENSMIDTTEFTNLMSSLKPGEDNVQYLEVDGKVIFVKPYKGEASTTSYDFAVITTNPDIMTDTYGKNYSKFSKDDLYIVDDCVAVAGLNLTTGKWEPFYIDNVALEYNVTEDEFAKVVDVAYYANLVENINLAESKVNDYTSAKNIVMTNGIVSVIDVNDNVYTIAEETNLVHYVNTNLVFNDEGKTNKITWDEEIEAARVSTTEDTVVVAVTDNGVYVRTGVQGSKKSIAGNIDCYSADASLIVFKTNSVPAGWGTGSAIAADETYLVVVPSTTIGYEAVAEDEYQLIISELFDLKTNDFVDVVMTYDSMPKNVEYDVGTVLHLNEEGDLVIGDLATAMTKILGDGWVDADVDFIDHETISIAGYDKVNTDVAMSNISATVVTIDLTGYDWADYDDSTFYVKGLNYEADKYEGVAEINIAGKVRYHYDIVLDTVTEINEPTLGVYTNFDKVVNGVSIYHIDNDKYSELFTTSIYTYANYDEDTNSVDLYIIKVVNAK